MNTEQLIGLLAAAVGIYFFTCSIWFKDFFLYKAKVNRATAFYGKKSEKVVHVFYSLLGLGAFIAGVLKIIKII